MGVGVKGVRRTMAGWYRHRGGRPVPEAAPVIGDGRGSTMRLLWLSAHPQPTRALIAGDLPAGSGGGAALSGSATAWPDFFPRPGHPTRQVAWGPRRAVSDRKSVVQGKRVSVLVDRGGRRSIKKQITYL